MNQKGGNRGAIPSFLVALPNAHEYSWAFDLGRENWKRGWLEDFFVDDD